MDGGIYMGREQEAQRQAAVREAAMASIRRKQMEQMAGGHAVMAGLLGFGEAAEGRGLFAKMVHGAKLFCIAFAFLTPNYLVWSILL
jgi:hypothetical protein